MASSRARSPSSPARPAETRVVLFGSLGDAGLEQRQEQVGLARELGVDDALGEAGLLGDGLQRGAGVPALEEHPSRGGEHEGAVALPLLRPGQPLRHDAETNTVGIRDVNGFWIPMALRALRQRTQVWRS